MAADPIKIRLTPRPNGSKDTPPSRWVSPRPNGSKLEPVAKQVKPRPNGSKLDPVPVSVKPKTVGSKDVAAVLPNKRRNITFATK